MTGADDKVEAASDDGTELFDADPDTDADDIIPLRGGSARHSGWRQWPTVPVGLATAGALLVVAVGAWQLAGPHRADDQAASAAPDGTRAEPPSEPVTTAAISDWAPAPAPAWPPVAAAPAEPAAMPPAGTSSPTLEASRYLTAEATAVYLARAEALLKAGDLAAARLFFERIAEAGDARGALGLARSYDPGTLRNLPVHGQAGDPVEAERWRVMANIMGGVEEAAR